MSEKPLLYVEDEPTDVLLLQFALKKAQITNPLQIAGDGEQAIAYLSGSGQYGNRENHPLPGLVLLDLNIPRFSGLEVLKWIREQPRFASLPVVVYTSSEDPMDQEQARQLGANDYIVKPPFVDKIAATLRKLVQQWLHHSQAGD